jgi:hypothetical protein
LEAAPGIFGIEKSINLSIIGSGWSGGGGCETRSRLQKAKGANHARPIFHLPEQKPASIHRHSGRCRKPAEVLVNEGHGQLFALRQGS